MHFKIQTSVFLAPNCQNEKTTRQINLVTEEMDLEAFVAIASGYTSRFMPSSYYVFISTE